MDTLFERLQAIDTTTLSDVGKQLRVMDAGLRPLRLSLKLVGRAVTVAAGDDLMPVLDGLARAGSGDVLVVDGGGSARALAGELFGSEALRRGLAGIVIDGACRDTNQLRQLPLPFYARGLSPRAAGAKAVPGERGGVRCGGVEVAPGDVLVGDDDGIVVGSPEELAAVLDAAEALQATEASMLAAIQGGESLFSRLDYDEHLARLRAGEESALRFVG
jgi:4-hydroxy-4-methyl-2-oxoglutarate aldolase